MANYKEIRQISASDLRNLCINENWYTYGDCKEYNNLLYDLASNKENLTTADIIAIATDIMKHSDCPEETITNIAFKVARKCFTLFEETE